MKAPKLNGWFEVETVYVLPLGIRVAQLFSNAASDHALRSRWCTGPTTEYGCHLPVIYQGPSCAV